MEKSQPTATAKNKIQPTENQSTPTEPRYKRAMLSSLHHEFDTLLNLENVLGNLADSRSDITYRNTNDIEIKGIMKSLIYENRILETTAFSLNYYYEKSRENHSSDTCIELKNDGDFANGIELSDFIQSQQNLLDSILFYRIKNPAERNTKVFNIDDYFSKYLEVIEPTDVICQNNAESYHLAATLSALALRPELVKRVFVRTLESRGNQVKLAALLPYYPVFVPIVEKVLLLNEEVPSVKNVYGVISKSGDKWPQLLERAYEHFMNHEPFNKDHMLTLFSGTPTAIYFGKQQQDSLNGDLNSIFENNIAERFPTVITLQNKDDKIIPFIHLILLDAFKEVSTKGVEEMFIKVYDPMSQKTNSTPIVKRLYNKTLQTKYGLIEIEKDTYDGKLIIPVTSITSEDYTIKTCICFKSGMTHALSRLNNSDLIYSIAKFEVKEDATNIVIASGEVSNLNGLFPFKNIEKSNFSIYEIIEGDSGAITYKLFDSHQPNYPTYESLTFKNGLPKGKYIAICRVKKFMEAFGKKHNSITLCADKDIQLSSILIRTDEIHQFLESIVWGLLRKANDDGIPLLSTLEYTTAGEFEYNILYEIGKDEPWMKGLGVVVFKYSSMDLKGKEQIINLIILKSTQEEKSKNLQDEKITTTRLYTLRSGHRFFTDKEKNSLCTMVWDGLSEGESEHYEICIFCKETSEVQFTMSL